MKKLLVILLLLIIANTNILIGLEKKPPEGFIPITSKSEIPKIPINWENKGLMPINTYFENKSGIINFWASWCGPCIIEIPDFEKLSKNFSKDNFLIAVISSERAGDIVAKNFLDELNIENLHRGYDPSKVLKNNFGDSGIPVSFIVNSKNKVLFRIDGVIDWNKPEIINYLKYIASIE